MTARDLSLERDLLRQGQARTGIEFGYDDLVAERLAYVQERHGDNWVSMPLAELVAELRREDLDVGGWSVLIAQHPDVLAMATDTQLRVRLRLLTAISLGARLEHEVRELERLV